MVSGTDVKRVYVSVGSNIERERRVQAAINRLFERFGELEISSVYETAAVGFDGDDFFNLVVGFDTSDSPEMVNNALKRIEHEEGRERGAKKFSSRTLDLDLLLYGDEVFERPGLQVPRDEIERYSFVLQPLAELIPQVRYPGRETTMQALWEESVQSHSMEPAQISNWVPQVPS